MRSQSTQKKTDDLTPHQRKVKLIAEDIKRKGEEKQENTPGREINTNSFRLGVTPRPNSVHTVGETAATRTITPISSRLFTGTLLYSPSLIKTPEHKTTLIHTATLGGTKQLSNKDNSNKILSAVWSF